MVTWSGSPLTSSATLGEVDEVFHEIVSDLVHIDVHHVKPQQDHPFHKLVTSGMSDRPMTAPPGAEDQRFAELVVVLPPEWDVSMDAFKREENYWPIRLMKILARLPHEYDTWLWWGHTVPNGEPPAPYAPNNTFTGAIITPALTLPQEFFELKISMDKTICFFAVIPLYTEEMELKLRKGADALFDRFDNAEVNEIIDMRRKNVCAPTRWWPFGRGRTRH